MQIPATTSPRIHAEHTLSHSARFSVANRPQLWERFHTGTLRPVAPCRFLPLKPRTPVAAPPERWLSAGEAAAELGIALRTMRRWLARYHAEGRYEVQATPGGHYRIPARVVAAVKAGTYEDPADARAVA